MPYTLCLMSCWQLTVGRANGEAAALKDAAAAVPVLGRLICDLVEGGEDVCGHARQEAETASGTVSNPQRHSFQCPVYKSTVSNSGPDFNPGTMFNPGSVFNPQGHWYRRGMGVSSLGASRLTHKLPPALSPSHKTLSTAGNGVNGRCQHHDNSPLGQCSLKS